MFIPEGLNGNSPAFQRRGPFYERTSPAGTAERAPQFMFQPSLRDVPRIEFEPGFETPGYCRLSLQDNTLPYPEFSRRI